MVSQLPVGFGLRAQSNYFLVSFVSFLTFFRGIQSDAHLHLATTFLYLKRLIFCCYMYCQAGETALSIAKAHNNTTMVEFLRPLMGNKKHTSSKQSSDSSSSSDEKHASSKKSSESSSSSDDKHTPSKRPSKKKPNESNGSSADGMLRQDLNYLEDPSIVPGKVLHVYMYNFLLFSNEQVHSTYMYKCIFKLLLLVHLLNIEHCLHISHFTGCAR